VKITSKGNVKMTDKKTEQDLIKIDQLPCITDNNTFKNSFKEKYNKIEDDLK
ncbi:3159_t:CDS:1, partial [Rhizophagus irregularis]